MFRTLLLTAIVALMALPLSAQKRSKPDKVTFSDGTTEAVRLQRGVGNYLGKEIGLRREADQHYQKFSPTEITEFTLGRSQRTYRSVKVEIADLQRQGVKAQTTRFGEVLVDGRIQLIKVHLALNEYHSEAVGAQPYLYLLRQGEVELVLELTTIRVYDIINANPSRFRNRLRYFVRDCPLAYDYAENAKFSDGDILRVLTDYASCQQIDNVQLNERRASGRLRLHHFARLSTLDLRDQHYSNRQLSAAFGYQGEALFSNRLRWLGVLLSAEYVYQSFRWEDRSNVQQSMVKSNLSIAVKPVQRGEFSLQITGGLSGYNATSSSFSSFFSNNYFLFSGGIRVRSHNYLFGISYEHMPNQIKRQPGNMLLLSVGYKFAGKE